MPQTHARTTNPKEDKSLQKSTKTQVKPANNEASEDAPYLLLYLSTDKHASPFDICMAYDIGFNAVVPYGNVTPEEATELVQDAVFSREPRTAKRTCFFVGGRDAEKAEIVLKAVKAAMAPPFNAPIIIDPAGAYTTAAAIVAKAEEALISNNIGELEDKTCTVLGTGSVGRTAAALLAKLGCRTIIASINPKRTDGKSYAEGVARVVSEGSRVSVQGVFAPTTAKKVEILKKADVVFCAGGRGIRVIEKDALKHVEPVKVLLDVNTIPPHGVEGLELKDDMKEISPGVFGIGGLAVGDVKHRLEKEILREARTNAQEEVYDCDVALRIARRLLRRSITPAKGRFR